MPFLFLLFSAERLSDRAIFLGSCNLNTLFSKSKALLSWVTLPDHLIVEACFFFAVDFLPRLVEPAALLVFFFVFVAIANVLK